MEDLEFIAKSGKLYNVGFLGLIILAYHNGPSVSSMESDSLDLFVRAGSTDLFHSKYTTIGNRWTDWKSLGGALESDPASVFRGPDRIHVFAVRSDKALWTRSLEPTGNWSDWVPLGGSWISRPTAASWGPNRLDVFAVDGDRSIKTRYWEPSTSWTPNWGWGSLGGSWLSAPAAASWGPNRLDVFAVGNDHAIYTAAWTPPPVGWSNFGSLGGPVQEFSGPAVSSRGPGKLDVFFVRPSGVLATFNFNEMVPNKWSPTKDIVFPGSPLLGSSPAAVSWGPDRIDVFTRAAADPETTPVWDRDIVRYIWEKEKNYWRKESLNPPDISRNPFIFG